MSQEEFEKILLNMLEELRQKVQLQTGQTVSSNYRFKLYGGGVSGQIVDLDDAMIILYIDEKTFWFVIDIAILSSNQTETLVFTRISGHQPCSLEQTWNYANGTGPFKALYYVKD